MSEPEQHLRDVLAHESDTWLARWAQEGWLAVAGPDLVQENDPHEQIHRYTLQRTFVATRLPSTPYLGGDDTSPIPPVR